jgi:hypothetical protein
MIIPDISQFNFQSGFGTINDVADSIGSLFGMGPKPRGPLTIKTQGQVNARIQEIIKSIPSVGIDSAISVVQKHIATSIKDKKGYRSSNSKFVAQTWVDGMSAFLPQLLAEKRKAQNPVSAVIDKITSTGSNVASDVKLNQASIGYFGMGLMLLYIFSQKKGKLRRSY